MTDHSETPSLPPRKVPNEYKSTFFMFAICFFLSLGLLFEFYLVGYLGYILDSLLTEVYRIEKDSRHFLLLVSLVNGLFMGGVILGNLTAEFISKRLGRVHLILLIDSLFICSLVFAQFFQEFGLLISRALSGYASGLNGVIIYVMIRELVSMKYKGTLISMVPFVGLNGFMISSLCALILKEPLGNSWRILFVIPIIFPLGRVLFLLVFMRRETPFWLYSKGRKEEAKEALGALYKEEFIERQFEKIEEEINLKAEAHWTPSAIVRTLHMVVVAFLEPSLGGNTLAFYAGDVWANICSQNAPPTCIAFYLTIYNFANMAFTLLAGVIYDSTGRKHTTVFATIMTGVALLLIGYGFSCKNNLVLAFLIYFYLFWVCIGIGTSWQILVVEVAPKFGVKMCVLALTLSNLLLSITYDYFERLFGQSNVFYVYAGLAFFLSGYILVFVKESRNKDQNQIAKEYMRIGELFLCSNSPNDK